MGLYHVYVYVGEEYCIVSAHLKYHMIDGLHTGFYGGGGENDAFGAMGMLPQEICIL